MTGTPLKVLLVDDDLGVSKAFDRVLARGGFEPTTVDSVRRARACLAADSFDVVVSDIHMPGEDGLVLLAEVRERDPDLPVILMTAVPQLESAMLALNLGAYRYLTKPVDPTELERTVRRAGLVRSFARLRRRALEAVGAEDASRLDLDQQLDRSIDALWMAFQPIVGGRGQALFGYEALVRTDSEALSRPDQLIAAATRLDRTNELGRTVRRLVAERVAMTPEPTLFFINLLPADLLDPELTDRDSPLTRFARRVMLEITERATLSSIPNFVSHVRNLRELGFRLAVDDLGAGYSGLASLTQLEPDMVKLDLSLVRGIHQSSARQAVVRSMVDLCGAMSVSMIAEGIEEPAESETLWSLGVQLLQGYHFGRPARVPEWTPRA